VLGLFAVALAVSPAGEYDLTLPPRALWKLWLSDHREVTFENEKEKATRFAIFANNVQRVRDLRSRYAATTKYDLTGFAHISPQEFKDMYLAKNIPQDFIFNPKTSDLFPLANSTVIDALPTSFDWRTHSPPVVTPIKDQGKCGSCWAFSTNGNIEGQWALAGNPIVSLSEQNLVDCCHECWHPGVCDQGCEGGLMANTFTCVLKQGGVDTESSYPYVGIDGFCKFNKKNIGSSINSFSFIKQDPEQMAAAVYGHGPISIAVDATNWQFYKSGVFHSECGTSINHAVVLVGFDVDQKTKAPYWIVKNSWGVKWGIKGYMLLQRGGNECGAEEYPITSIIDS